MKKQHIEYHKDGSVWAKGEIDDGIPNGYWEWLRKDGTKMRSGYFDRGLPVSDWITYRKDGRVVKVTNMDKKSKFKR